MKRYIKKNNEVLKLINNKKYVIESIRTVKKKIKKGLYIYDEITSYCVKYRKMV